MQEIQNCMEPIRKFSKLPLGNQLNDREFVSMDSMKTHIGIRNPIDMRSMIYMNLEIEWGNIKVMRAGSLI